MPTHAKFNKSNKNTQKQTSNRFLVWNTTHVKSPVAGFDLHHVLPCSLLWWLCQHIWSPGKSLDHLFPKRLKIRALAWSHGPDDIIIASALLVSPLCKMLFDVSVVPYKETGTEIMLLQLPSDPSPTTYQMTNLIIGVTSLQELFQGLCLSGQCILLTGIDWIPFKNNFKKRLTFSVFPQTHTTFPKVAVSIFTDFDDAGKWC